MGLGLIPGQETKILQAVQHSEKKKGLEVLFLPQRCGLAILKLLSIYSRTEQISKYIIHNGESMSEKAIANMEKDCGRWLTSVLRN